MISAAPGLLCPPPWRAPHTVTPVRCTSMAQQLLYIDDLQWPYLRPFHDGSQTTHADQVQTQARTQSACAVLSPESRASSQGGEGYFSTCRRRWYILHTARPPRTEATARTTAKAARSRVAVRSLLSGPGCLALEYCTQHALLNTNRDHISNTSTPQEPCVKTRVLTGCEAHPRQLTCHVHAKVAC
jgi:hypothetical protein